MAKQSVAQDPLLDLQEKISLLNDAILQLQERMDKYELRPTGVTQVDANSNFQDALRIGMEVEFRNLISLHRPKEHVVQSVEKVLDFASLVHETIVSRFGS